jgi:hypothetical protein
MQTFNYLRSNPLNGAAIEDTYPGDAVLQKVILRNEADNLYYVFDSCQEALNLIKHTPRDKRCFHEVIYGSKQQKLKFDIDIAKDELYKVLKNDSTNKNNSTVVTYSDVEGFLMDLREELLSAIVSVFNEIYPLENNIDPNDVIICSSVDPLVKYSYHYIINGYCVNNNIEAGFFTKKVCSLLNSNFQQFIDYSTSKSIQNFRTIYSHKRESDRTKIMEAGELKVSDIDTFITYTENCILLHPIKIVEHKNSKSIVDKSDTLWKKLEKFCPSKYIDGSTFREMIDNLIVFSRTEPSMCPVCIRQHDHDNTAMIYLIPTYKQIAMYFKCRKNDTKVHIADVDLDKIENDTKLTNDTTSTDQIAQPLINIQSMYTSKIKYFINKDLTREEIVYKGKTKIFENKELDEYPKSEILLVRAPMKMGKTKKLIEYMNKYFKNSTIVIISFRCTFSLEMKRKFENFSLYSSIKGRDISLKEHKRLIIQVESLYRLKNDENIYPDLLILDESESIIEQTNSGLSKYFSIMFGKFEWIIKNSKHICAMDANLGNRTVNILRVFRSNLDHVALFYEDTYKNATEDTYIVTKDINSWLKKLMFDISNNKKICIICNSLIDLETIMSSIQNRFPNKKIMFYTSKTTKDTKSEHFKDVNKKWNKYDIIGYTPTVSAGISFEEIHFDKMYCYFIDTSCPVSTCMQMLGRIRNLNDKEYNVYIKSYRKWYPTTIESIERNLINQRLNLFNLLAPDALQIAYSKEGKVIFVKNSCYYVYIENLAHICLSRNKFLELFIEYARNLGASVVELQKSEVDSLLSTLPNTLDNIIAYTETKNKLRELEFSAIANAEDIGDDEYLDIENRKQQEQNIMPEEMLCYEKKKLIKFLELEKYNIAKITPLCVKTYNNKHAKDVRINLIKINQFKYTNADALVDNMDYDLKNELGDTIINTATSNVAPKLIEPRTNDPLLFMKINEKARYINSCQYDKYNEVRNVYRYVKCLFIYDLFNIIGIELGHEHICFTTGKKILNAFNKKECISLFQQNEKMISQEFGIKIPQEITLKKYLAFINKILYDTFDVSIVELGKFKVFKKMHLYYVKLSNLYDIDMRPMII